MRPEEFERYVSNQLSRGTPRGSLTASLLAGGWDRGRIDRAISKHDKLLHKELQSKRFHFRGVFRTILWSVFMILLIAFILFLIGSNDLNIYPVL